MTWKEIKNKIEELGVKDKDIVSFLSTEEVLININDLNSQTVQMLAPSNNTNEAVNCWEIYV